MKNLLGVLFISILTVSQVRAAEYECVGENNAELSIKTYQINVNTRNANTAASIVLKNQGLVKILSGSYSDYGDNIGFDLHNDEGDSALLKISTVQKLGGRCGRCSPDIELKTYAKLIINNDEMDFTCYPKLID
jgi:hypothetical protein